MDLKNIGFYTLSDRRAQNTSQYSQLQRCELLLTSRCNFKCPYCRGMKPEDRGDISFDDARRVVGMWSSHQLKNIRFSGGEPTLWAPLSELVKSTRQQGVERIAISTNGSADPELYDALVSAGVNDVSISLDSCCASTGNRMAGREGVWETIVTNIRRLSKSVYVTVGVVLTADNYPEVNDIVRFASSLGVADIRIIPAAQLAKQLQHVKVDSDILRAHPIMDYRYKNFISGRGVRGLTAKDSRNCALALDDMAVLNGKHYPCIIYMRERGAPVGSMAQSIEAVRAERAAWANTHDCLSDPICRNNCLDVCVDYNNKVQKLQPGLFQPIYTYEQARDYVKRCVPGDTVIREEIIKL